VITCDNMGSNHLVSNPIGTIVPKSQRHGTIRFMGARVSHRCRAYQSHRRTDAYSHIKDERIVRHFVQSHTWQNGKIVLEHIFKSVLAIRLIITKPVFELTPSPIPSFGTCSCFIWYGGLLLVAMMWYETNLASGKKRGDYIFLFCSFRCCVFLCE